jgi:hypothetical protein
MPDDSSTYILLLKWYNFSLDDNFKHLAKKKFFIKNSKESSEHTEHVLL